MLFCLMLLCTLLLNGAGRDLETILNTCYERSTHKKKFKAAEKWMKQFFDIQDIHLDISCKQKTQLSL